MKREQALPYVSYWVDDAGAAGMVDAVTVIPANARLVVFSCGFEPLAVAVWSYLPGVRLDDQDAEDLAIDFLCERGWFSQEPDQSIWYTI